MALFRCVEPILGRSGWKGSRSKRFDVYRRWQSDTAGKRLLVKRWGLVIVAPVSKDFPWEERLHLLHAPPMGTMISLYGAPVFFPVSSNEDPSPALAGLSKSEST